MTVVSAKKKKTVNNIFKDLKGKSLFLTNNFRFKNLTINLTSKKGTSISKLPNRM